jgi:hypothetical protein
MFRNTDTKIIMSYLVGIPSVFFRVQDKDSQENISITTRQDLEGSQDFETIGHTTHRSIHMAARWGPSRPTHNGRVQRTDSRRSFDPLSVSGSAVGNNNQYVDTGLSYMTRRRQGNKEVVGSWLGRLPASLGSCHMTKNFRKGWPSGRPVTDRVIPWPPAKGQGRV